ncbi:hypothetical protein N7491_011074 [Penicillium cf. griseofulvum]|nr:hypothetical protein N7491_011074 [Penicillium cf. griseofulvum]
MTSSLFTAPFRHGVQRLPIKMSNLATPRIVHNIASNITRSGRLPFQPSAKINHLRPTAEPTADNLIEELQDLYGIAKDLFETASDSTEKESINAEADRESLRDALDQLVTVYEVYTTGEKGAGISGGDGASKEGEPGLVFRTNFDPGSISDTVMGDVRKRFGQKVVDLRNAVEALEDKAKFSFNITYTFIGDKVDEFALSAVEAFNATSGFDDLRIYISYSHSTEGLNPMYGPEKLPRLLKLKKKWDPKGLFNYNNGLLH